MRHGVILPGGVQDIFEVNVADDGAVVPSDREARIARVGDLLLDVGGGSPLRQHDELVEGNHRGPSGFLGELQGATEQTQLICQHAFGLRSDDDRGHLLDRVGGRDFRARLVARHAHKPVREVIHGLDDRTQDVAQAHEDGGQDQQHPHGGGNRDVFGDHLAEHDMAEEDDDEGRRKSDDVAGRLGRAQALKRRLDEVRDRGLGDDAQGRGRDRHTQLADRQHVGDMPQGEESSAGSAPPRPREARPASDASR